MRPLSKAYAGKRVFVTGHTGFKGSWLCEWLLAIGADVMGFSLAPPTSPSLFAQLGLARRVGHTHGDVRDLRALARALRSSRPDYVFHLAAQPIVGASLRDPGETWSTNVMGTVNLLESVRLHAQACPCVIVTTDKVYGTAAAVRTEAGPLAGAEPYGASKASAELAASAWRSAYGLAGVATARSGNVIGGGDWGAGRLVPDCVRALRRGLPVRLRNPSAVRPWQHVLDPVHGYLRLGAWLGAAHPRAGLGAFNFGPAPGDHRAVREVVEEVLSHWPGSWRRAPSRGGPGEDSVLRLSSRRARAVLGWRPLWRFSESVARTVDWYRGARSPASARELTRLQISEFSEAAA
jgi:CDP-glucose 4,6-dehydratase